VILLQSDHGSASLMADEQAAPEQWETFVRERLPVLNAYLVPPGMRAALDESTSPVNSFRLLFNELFDTDYPALPNRHYMSWYRTPNKVVDVSDIAGRGAPGRDAVSRYTALASELSPD
jgi:hypothetical protein